MGIHTPNIADLADVARGVVDGTPRSIAFQNRLLGPWSVMALTELGWSFETALRRFHFVALAVWCCVLMQQFALRGISVAQSVGLLTTTSFCFLVLQFYWYHTWDIVDLIVFSLFADGILRSRSTTYFLLLFLFGIANRESALFIPLYLSLRGFEFGSGRWLPGLVSTPRVVTGALLVLLGAAAILVVRQLLFRHVTPGMDEVANDVLGNEIHLTNNLTNLVVTNLRSVNFIYTLFVLGPLVYFGVRFAQLADPRAKCFVMCLALVANIMVFGIVVETRMLFVLLPMYLFLWLDLHQRALTQPEVDVAPTYGIR